MTLGKSPELESILGHLGMWYVLHQVSHQGAPMSALLTFIYIPSLGRD